MTASEPERESQAGIDEHPYRIKVLMRMDRWALALGLSFAVFLVLVLMSAIGPAPMRRVIETADAMWYLFSAMITAIITAVTLVATINQLVLSQELGALGDQRERMRGANEFLEEVEPWLDANVAPAEPATFLAAMLDSVQHIGDDLAASIQGGGRDEASQQIQAFVDALTAQAESVRRLLRDAQFGTFDVVFAVLTFDYSWRTYEAKRLRAAHRDSLGEESSQRLADIVTMLEHFGPAREHFKTLYFQWELVNLSKGMLYSSLPALAVAAGMLLYVDTAGVTGASLGVDHLVLLVCASLTLCLFPFLVFLSFILRIVTVTKRTLAMGPFVLQEIERPLDFAWS